MSSTVKLGAKEQFDKEQIGVKPASFRGGGGSLGGSALRVEASIASQPGDHTW
jgi:hypothetical protein